MNKFTENNVSTNLPTSTDSQIPIPGVEISEPKKKRSIDELPFAFSLLELEDFDLPEPEPIVEGLLYRKNLSVMSAKPKAGKSTLARYASKLIADGEPFLGRSTIQSKILYLVLEEPLQNVKADFVQMVVGSKENILMSEFRGEKRFEKLNATLEESRPALVIVDTMSHILEVSDLNDYTQTTSALKKFRDLANDYNTHFMFIHHSRKGDGKGSDSILGSTGISGAVDIFINLEVDSKEKRLLSSKGRLGDHFNEVEIFFDTELKHFKLPENRRSEVETSILDCVSKEPGLPQDVIREKVSRSNKLVGVTLQLLSRSGEIRIEHDGDRNRYYPALPEKSGSDS